MAPPSISSAQRVDPEILQSWVRAYSEATGWQGGPPDIDSGTESTRSGSDSQAAWQRWHQGTCASWFSESQKQWYTALERARVECLAGRELPGVARNLKALPFEGVDLTPATRQLYRSARTRWGLGFDDSRPDSTDGSKTGEDRAPSLVQRFRRLVNRGSTSKNLSSEAKEALDEAGRCLADERSFARIVYPLIVRLDDSPRSTIRDPDELERDEVERYEFEDDAEVGFGEDQQPESRSRIGDYAIFRTRWDECEPARVWHRPEDAEALRELNALDRRDIQRLAHDLQRRLLVQRLRHWDFELEEGMLDSRKLAALVGERPDNRVFKFEREARIPEACVTLLVDQSGSMRGPAHRLAAQAIDVAVHTLEVCGVAVEVLGFTTAYGAENPVVDCWRKAGKPDRPGRLNALRHLILKAAGQPWRVARRHLGLLLRPDFGHENIDGESLCWAARRLLARSERRKILIVISDGSPYDEASIDNNGSQYLLNHLSDVTEAIEKTPVHLIGIGTGRYVGRYYRNAATVRRGDMIGNVLFRTLVDSLDQSAVP